MHNVDYDGAIEGQVNQYVKEYYMK